MRPNEARGLVIVALEESADKPGSSEGVPPSGIRNLGFPHFGDDICDEQVGIVRYAEVHADPVEIGFGWARESRRVGEGQDRLRALLRNGEVGPTRYHGRVESFVRRFFGCPPADDRACVRAGEDRARVSRLEGQMTHRSARNCSLRSALVERACHSFTSTSERIRAAKRAGLRRDKTDLSRASESKSTPTPRSIACSPSETDELGQRCSSCGRCLRCFFVLQRGPREGVWSE